MANIFNMDLSGQIYSCFKGRVQTGTLTRVTFGARDLGDLTAGRPEVRTDYAFEGFIETDRATTFNSSFGDGSVVVETFRKLSIFGSSVSVEPLVGDEVAILGSTYRIVEILEVDPAEALYACRVSSI